MKAYTNKFKIIKNIVIIVFIIISFSGCSVIERIAEYNLERLYEEKEAVIDDTIYLPESTYVKDTIELTMVNPKSLNPIDSIDYGIDQVLKLVYQPVLKLTSDYELENGLISSYEKISEKVYRFTISDKAFFHNDIPVLVQDIKFTFDLISKTENSPYSFSLSYIEAITEINEKVFEVKFNTLDYFNLYALTFPVVSKDYVSSKEYDPLVPIGSGPYQYDAFQSMLRFDLKANDHYMYDKPVSPKVTVNIIRDINDDYNMFLAKRIDIHSPSMTKWDLYSDDRKIKIYTYDSPYFYFFGINHENYLINDLIGRRLIAATLPYESIQKDAFLGHLNLTTLPIKSTHVLSKSMDQYFSVNDEESFYHYLYKKDMIPSYLKLLRQEDHYRLDYSPTTIDIIYNADDFYSNKIVDVLKKEVTIHQLVYNYIALDKEAFKLALEQKTYDLYIGVLKTSIIPNLNSLYTSTGSFNLGGYNSINVNGLLSTYRKVSNSEQFVSQLENFSKVVAEELPLIPLGFLENGLFIHEYVGQGAQPLDFDIYNQLEYFEIIK